eukprot:14951762-Alexandrium_andersonii.AAC.1
MRTEAVHRQPRPAQACLKRLMSRCCCRSRSRSVRSGPPRAQAPPARGLTRCPTHRDRKGRCNIRLCRQR